MDMLLNPLIYSTMLPWSTTKSSQHLHKSNTSPIPTPK